MSKTFITHFLFRTGAFIFWSHIVIPDLHDTFFLASHHNVEIDSFIDLNIQIYIVTLGRYTIYQACLFSVINSLICNTGFINESMDPDGYTAIYIQIPLHHHTNLAHLLRQPQINIPLDKSLTTCHYNKTLSALIVLSCLLFQSLKSFRNRICRLQNCNWLL